MTTEHASNGSPATGASGRNSESDGLVSATEPRDFTYLLSQITAGDRRAAGQLLPLVYEELRKLAAAKMADERSGQTLQATALVHEAYLRLIDTNAIQHWNSRNHFFAAAAEAMRRILVEAARRKHAAKHGGRHLQVELDDVVQVPPDYAADDLLALDEALTELAAVAPDKAAVVQLRYFAGLSWEEVAACRDVSLATAKRHWTVARAWLYDHLSRAARSEKSGENS